jgi:modulator of FtsH protease HflC
MRLNLFGGLIAALVVVALIVAYGTLFTVYQTRQALVVRLGQPVRVITDPGLNVKVPLIDSVINIDKRILDLENPAQEVIASDQKRLVVDAFARYRIKDVLKFYQTVGTVDGANSQLSILLNSALRRVLGEATLTQVVRDQREHLMTRVREQLDNEAQGYGISVVDVRIRRADLPEQNSQAVYQRMQTERQQEAAQYRAEGAQKAQEIRAKADRDVTVLLAEAQSKGERTRGEGDGERNRIFADAYSRDPDFFAFYRSMQAYERMTRACCSSPIRNSSVSSWIHRASRAKATRQRAPQRLRGSGGLRRHLRRLGKDGPIRRRDRPGARHRRPAFRGFPPPGKTAGGERAGEPGNVAASRRHRLRCARHPVDLDRARLSRRAHLTPPRKRAAVPIPP